jgi:hypothetical protein
LLAHHAKLNHTVAPRICGQVAADLTRASRAQIHPKREISRQRGLLNGLQSGPCLHRQGGPGHIHWRNRVHARQRECNPTGNRYRPARHARQATLRHHRHTVGMTQSHHTRDGFCVTRKDQRQRTDRRRAAPVAQMMSGNRLARLHS